MKNHIHTGYMWKIIKKNTKERKCKNEKFTILLENINRKYKGKTFMKSIYHV